MVSIIVEGIIGAGKTTASEELVEMLGNALLLKEPVVTSLLEKYYSNPSRWSFTIQCDFLVKRFRMLLHAQWHVLSGCGNAVLDRSYYGDTAFARVQKLFGYMTQEEFDIYTNLYQTMTASVLHPNMCLFLNVNPEVAQKRIQKRLEQQIDRRCESVIPLEYLIALDRELRVTIETLAKVGTEVIEIDWNEDRDKEQRNNMLKKVVKRIHDYKHVNFTEYHNRIM